MISLDKCSESCNSADDLFTKICILRKTNGINVKIFNMITNRNEAKMLENISYVIVNVNWISQHVIPVKNRIMINVNVNVSCV